MSSKFTFKWSSTIDDISFQEWKRIYGSDIIKSHGFMKANEMAELDDVDFCYLQVRYEGDIVAIVPCFVYNMDLMHLSSSNSIKMWIGKLRKLSPNFLKLRTFVIGSYAATCEHFMEHIPNLSDNVRKNVAEIIRKEIKMKCKETKSFFILIKDIRERSLQSVKDLLTSDYKFVVSFPTTAIPIINGVSYPIALRKKNRKRYRNFTERFDRSFHWEIIKDYGGQPVKDFTPLYQKVLDKAKVKFEFLNEKFFEATNDLLGDASFFLVAKDNTTDEIRVMVIIMENEWNLIPLYMGFKYKNDDSKVLYINTIFRTIKEAEARGKKYIDFGQMSYYPKTMSGALVENIYYGFWSDNIIMKWLINHGVEKMFAPPTIPEHVYLDKYASDAHKVLTERGFVLLN